MKNGSSDAVINITIYNDSIPELNETFQVSLTKVEVIDAIVLPFDEPKINVNNVINVTILSNDYPYGIFELSVDMAMNYSKYVLFEPDGRNLPLTFNIYRRQGN